MSTSETPPTDDDRSKKRSSKSNGTETEGAGVSQHGVGDVEPVPKNLEFYEWLEGLFDGSNQFPELIQWQVQEKRGPGPTINKVVYRPKSPKPSREELVKLSNRIIADCQYDCDVQRKTVTYRIAALHFAKDSDPYAQRKIRCEPRPLGSGHEDPREEEEESVEKRFSNVLVRHQETMVPQMIEGYGGLLGHMEAIVDRQARRIAELENRCNQQADMIERLQSLREDRDRARRWDEMKIESLGKARDMVLPMLPPMASQMLGKPEVAKGDSLEALTLRNFLGSIKEEQAEMILGKWENEVLVLPGILAEQQASIFIGVALCRLPLDQIDDLLPGGACEISNEQMMAVMGTGVTMPQLLPLRNLFEGRLKRKTAAANKQA